MKRFEALPIAGRDLGEIGGLGADGGIGQRVAKPVRAAGDGLAKGAFWDVAVPPGSVVGEGDVSARRLGRKAKDKPAIVFDPKGLALDRSALRAKKLGRALPKLRPFCGVSRGDGLLCEKIAQGSQGDEIVENGVEREDAFGGGVHGHGDHGHRRFGGIDAVGHASVPGECLQALELDLVGLAGLIARLASGLGISIDEAESLWKAGEALQGGVREDRGIGVGEALEVDAARERDFGGGGGEALGHFGGDRSGRKWADDDQLLASGGECVGPGLFIDGLEERLRLGGGEIPKKPGQGGLELILQLGDGSHIESPAGGEARAGSGDGAGEAVGAGQKDERAGGLGRHGILERLQGG